MARKTHKRKLSNILLQPLVQVKLGLYAIMLALVFCVFIVWVYYANFHEFYQLVLDLTDLREEVTSLMSEKMSDLVTWTVLAVLVYFALTVFMSVFFTHRLVGPTYAFRRHIQELSKGNYKSRVTLRKADAFAEVATELNKLADVLQNNRDLNDEARKHGN